MMDMYLWVTNLTALTLVKNRLILLVYSQLIEISLDSAFLHFPTKISGNSIPLRVSWLVIRKRLIN